MSARECEPDEARIFHNLNGRYISVCIFYIPVCEGPGEGGGGSMFRKTAVLI